MKKIAIILASLILLTACSKVKIDTAEITEEGLITLFKENVTDEEGKLIGAETSAVAYDGKKLIIANDKPIPLAKHSPVFQTEINDYSNLAFLENTNFIHSFKYEAATVTPDKKYILLSTGFDRVKEDSNEWDGYNTVLAWPKDSTEQVQIVSQSENEGIVSSVGIRTHMKELLKEDYFKVEGLAAMPDNKLLFGIREIGPTYEDITYSIKIISVSYKINNNEIQLQNDWQLLYDIDPKTLNLPEDIALSSLEYNKYTKSLMMLTSFENDEKIGGYLWEIKITDLKENSQPRLILKNDKTPLKFTHKPEGLAVIDGKTLFIIHDDDRVYETPDFTRKHNQAAYSIVKY